MNDFEFDENDLKIERENGIYLSNNEVKVLEKNNINYSEFPDLKSLIFYLNECDDDEIEELAINLSEFNYYNNIPK